MSERVTPEHLKRSAFVYVRQSSAQQVLYQSVQLRPAKPALSEQLHYLCQPIRRPTTGLTRSDYMASLSGRLRNERTVVVVDIEGTIEK